MSWNVEIVPAVAVVTCQLDGEQYTRSYADTVKLRRFVEWAASNGREPVVSTTCTRHGASIVQAVSDGQGVQVGECVTCAEDREAAERRRRADRNRQAQESSRRYSARVARYGS